MRRRLIKMTNGDAELLTRVMNRRFVGYGGLEVRSTPDEVAIVDRRRNYMPAPQAPPVWLQRVRVECVGGAPGSPGTRCSWVYDAYPIRGDMMEENRIAQGISEVGGRADVGRYRAAEVGTLAILAIDFECDPEDPGRYMLPYVADEVPECAVCNAAAP